MKSSVCVHSHNIIFGSLSLPCLSYLMLDTILKKCRYNSRSQFCGVINMFFFSLSLFYCPYWCWSFERTWKRVWCLYITFKWTRKVWDKKNTQLCLPILFLKVTAITILYYLINTNTCTDWLLCFSGVFVCLFSWNDKNSTVAQYDPAKRGQLIDLKIWV